MKDRKNLDPQLKRVLALALESLDSPVSLSTFILLKYGEYDQLVSRSVSPLQYLDTITGALRYWKDAQAQALIRKVPQLPTSFSTREVAEKSFFTCERACAETNYRIDAVTSGLPVFNGVDTAPFRDLLVRMKKVIARVLGPVPSSLPGRFGPGTSFELQDSTFSTLADKVCSTEPAVTRAAEPYFRHDYDSTLWGLSRSREGLPYLKFVPGNRFTTVPKDGKTDRGICIEPVGNLWVQLAVGDFLKRRLKLIGIDVSRSSEQSDPLTKLRHGVPVTGQTIHRRWAEMASRDGAYATLDLSSASDTISRGLVRALLPSPWFSLLNDIRSHRTRINNKWVYLEKFSSMGNGFTFELETLVFVAAIAAVTGLRPGSEFSVYGDDIIIPRQCHEDVIAALTFLGFQVNNAKSFYTGLFRESCGGDYMCGIDVRPVFVKRQPATPLEWMDLHNLLMRGGFPPHVLKVCISQVPSRLRLRGPIGSNGTFWTRDRSEFSFAENRKLNSPWMLWYRCLVPASRRLKIDRWAPWSHLTLGVLGVSSSGIVPRGDVTGWKISVSSCS